jgi:organic radical activating enzyme
MRFIRLTGCHVGGSDGRCQLLDGRSFACDTDYRSKMTLTVEELTSRVECEHVCITGGEPLDHRLEPLLAALKKEKHFIHLETGGSIEAPSGIDWITVSPKRGCLDTMLKRANEIKILVGPNFDIDFWKKKLSVTESRILVYLQAISDHDELVRENIDRVCELCLENPGFRAGMQLHKLLHVR